MSIYSDALGQLHICNMFLGRCQHLIKACCITCTTFAVSRIQEGISCHPTVNYFNLHRLRLSGTISITAAVDELCPERSVTKANGFE